MTRGPVLIELDETGEEITPAEAAPVPDPVSDVAPTGAAMRQAAAIAARRPSGLARWFWGLLAATLGFFVSVAAWQAVTTLLLAYPLLGMAATVLLGALVLVALLIAIKEIAAFRRLGRIDALKALADAAHAEQDLAKARKATRGLAALYRGRKDMRWPLTRVKEREADVLDADALLMLAEREMLAGLDAAALREVETAARQVATVTALVPLALADVVAALTANLRMIRRVADIYGGRSGTLGAWRLTRAVLSHLVATGAVAVGDDLLGSIAGGGLLAKVSRRFGEGLVNGALTARVGVAAIEVCRPLPFHAEKRPSVTALVSRALTGLFDKEA